MCAQKTVAQGPSMYTYTSEMVFISVGLEITSRG